MLPRSLCLALLAAHAFAQTCSYNGAKGSCINVNRATCKGTLRTGLCPGAANIKCCDPVGATCSYAGAKGKCINSAKSRCSGSLRSGLCPGAAGIKCCLPPKKAVGVGKKCLYGGSTGTCLDSSRSKCKGTFRSGLCPGGRNVRCCDPVGATCSYGGRSGSCINTQRAGCAGTIRSGLCPGSSSIKCCLAKAAAPAPAPRPAPSKGGCRTKVNGYSGTCKAVSSCAGGTFNGLCKGSSSTKCCVKDPTKAPRATKYVTLGQFRKSFESVGLARARGMLPYFNAALAKVLKGAKSAKVRCRRIAAFVAQVGHESVGLLYFEEIASGAAYEGRKDLGNTQRGDGRRFKGRGPIQLTGRANYRAAGKALGLKLTTYPESVSFPSVGFRTTVWYWNSRKLNRYADSGRSADFTVLTRRINGGTNGLADRRRRWADAKRIFKC